MATKTAKTSPAAADLPARRTVSAASPVAAPRRAASPIPIEAGSDNVFADVGLPDAPERMAKAMLSRIIRERVGELDWTQRAAATALGIATSDMSDLMRGKLARFSQERLELLNALELDVVISVGPKPAWKATAGVTVTRVREFTR